MCGICGLISRRPILNRAPVAAMQNALVHRGPDGAGEFSDVNLAMAMRRLSIIDLEGGWQTLYLDPLFSSQMQQATIMSMQKY